MNLLVDSNLDSCGAVKKGRNAGITARTGPRGYREVVEEIITALSRIRWLFVIARNSSFTYKGQAIDVKQVERKLGVRSVSSKGQFRKARGAPPWPTYLGARPNKRHGAAAHRASTPHS